jgi:hypothetical protein
VSCRRVLSTISSSERTSPPLPCRRTRWRERVEWTHVGAPAQRHEHDDWVEQFYCGRTRGSFFPVSLRTSHGCRRRRGGKGVVLVRVERDAEFIHLHSDAPPHQPLSLPDFAAAARCAPVASLRFPLRPSSTRASTPLPVPAGSGGRGELLAPLPQPPPPPFFFLVAFSRRVLGPQPVGALRWVVSP